MKWNEKVMKEIIEANKKVPIKEIIGELEIIKHLFIKRGLEQENEEA